jgi:hypothetical protein
MQEQQGDRMIWANISENITVFTSSVLSGSGATHTASYSMIYDPNTT